MIVMSVDPALRNTGVTIYNTALDILIHAELIVTAKSKDKKVKVTADLDQATAFIAGELQRLINDYEPDTIVFETSAAAGKSAMAARSLGIIKGVMWGVITANGIEAVTYTENEVKKGVGAVTKNSEKRELMDIAIKHYPQLNVKEWQNKSTGELLGKFEHIADSVCVYLTHKSKGNTCTTK